MKVPSIISQSDFANKKQVIMDYVEFDRILSDIQEPYSTEIEKFRKEWDAQCAANRGGKTLLSGDIEYLHEKYNVKNMNLDEYKNLLRELEDMGAISYESMVMGVLGCESDVL